MALTASQIAELMSSQGTQGKSKDNYINYKLYILNSWVANVSCLPLTEKTCTGFFAKCAALLPKFVIELRLATAIEREELVIDFDS